MTTAYLICYDIHDDKRRRRLHRQLSTWALPLQLSVFYCACDERVLEQRLAPLVSLLDLRKDDLRCYALPARGARYHLGAALLPEGIVWSAMRPLQPRQP